MVQNFILKFKKPYESTKSFLYIKTSHSEKSNNVFQHPVTLKTFQKTNCQQSEFLVTESFLILIIYSKVRPNFRLIVGIKLSVE